MNRETLYCPNPACRLDGVQWRQSLLVKNGSSRGYKQAVCRACGQSVMLRYGTAYFELEADPAIFDIAIAPWPKEIPCAVPHGSFTLTRIRSAPGWIGPPGIVATSCCICGSVCRQRVSTG